MFVLFKIGKLRLAASALMMFLGAITSRATVYDTIFGGDDTTVTISQLTKTSDGYYTVTKDFDGVTWTLTTDAYYANSVTIGDMSALQFGSGSKELKFATLTTSGIPGTITAITVYAINPVGGADNPVSLSITIGDQTVCEDVELGVNYTKYTNEEKRAAAKHSFTCSASGEIEIELSRSKAYAACVYISEIYIEYYPTEYTIDEEAEDNSIVDDDYANVTVNRTFSADYWNTLCLPFAVSSSVLTDIFGEGSSLRRFSSVADGSTLNFDEAESIEAGVPYLFKPATTVTDPKFEEVEIVSSDPVADTYEGFSFIGIYNATTLSTTDVFLGTDGSLHYPSSSSSSLKGTRAYFTFPEGQDISAAKLRIGDEEISTAILSVADKTSEVRSPIYTLQGIRIDGDTQSVSKGLYIRDGKKVIIK